MSQFLSLTRKVSIGGDGSVSSNIQTRTYDYFSYCSVFVFLVLKAADLQLRRDEASKMWLTVTAHLRLACFTRMIYVNFSAPVLIHNVLDRSLVGLCKAVCYLDDVHIGEVSCHKRGGGEFSRALRSMIFA